MWLLCVLRKWSVEPSDLSRPLHLITFVKTFWWNWDNFITWVFIHNFHEGLQKTFKFSENKSRLNVNFGIDSAFLVVCAVNVSFEARNKISKKTLSFSQLAQSFVRGSRNCTQINNNFCFRVKLLIFVFKIKNRPNFKQILGNTVGSCPAQPQPLPTTYPPQSAFCPLSSTRWGMWSPSSTTSHRRRGSSSTTGMSCQCLG